MKASFPELSEGMQDNNASIFMSDNFRCDEGIIDFSNEIFDRIFTVLQSSVSYAPGDRLRFAKRYDDIPKPPYRKPELCLLPSGTTSKKMTSDEGDEVGLEPQVVAEKIRELLNGGTLNSGEPIRPGDIAIILRINKGRDKKFAAALEALGIPSAVADTADFFLNPEILLLMSILNTIDNPNRDIYLASALMSPIFGFTADDMAIITRKRADTL
jgi:ATP-dependent helicase/nuclease subunit A